MFHKFSFYLLLIPIFLSCSSNDTYLQKFEIAERTWHSSQVVQFDWDIVDTTSFYDMELEITHELNFRFQNQYVKALTVFPDSTSSEQILSLELFDSSGRPYGKCGNAVCKTPILLQPNIKFPFPGSYHLKLQQNGREASSQGIHAIQLKVIKSI
ncbi:MAG: gliding motility lipoprotein GldH [Saprospiraceae bacterium]|nr:gliding motility lipoprotein GldH [Saprospiraceae bacterium]